MTVPKEPAALYLDLARSLLKTTGDSLLSPVALDTVQPYHAEEAHNDLK